jgi:hypothetical protein
MALVRLALRLAPGRLLAWMDRGRAALDERVAALAWRQGTSRWKQGRTAHHQVIPF